MRGTRPHGPAVVRAADRAFAPTILAVSPSSTAVSARVRTTPPRPIVHVAAFAAALLLLAGAVGCSGGATFDPSGPCVADGRAPGAYPELEALPPKLYVDRPPDRLDSGRNCTDEALGTLAEHGVDEVRYGGATWDLGSSSGVTMAVLEADGLRADWVAEFYEAGARGARRVEELTVGPIALGEAEGTRIDVLNGESFQTVVVAPGDADRVRVVLVASDVREIETRAAHDTRVVGALTLWFPGVCCN